MEDKNIVLLVADTLSAFHLPLYGYERDTSPFLSRLAKRNCFIRYGYANGPWTIPSHASLFSGKLPKEHGSTSKNIYFDEDSFIESLNEKGYYTFGISNNPVITEEFGYDKGFDHFIDGASKIYAEIKGAPTFRRIFDEKEYENVDSIVKKGTDYLSKSVRNLDFQSLIEGAKYFIGEISGPDFGRPLPFMSDSGAHQTNEYIKENLSFSEENFFLFVNYMEPHAPYSPPIDVASKWLSNPEDVIRRYQDEVGDEQFWEDVPHDFVSEKVKSLYDAEIRYLDKKIEELYSFLQENFDDTVFIIIGDHGENFGEYGTIGHWFGIWPKLIRVPIIIAGSDIENQIIERNVSLRELHDFILGEISIEDLGSKTIFAEYYGAIEFEKKHRDLLPEGDAYHDKRKNLLLKNQSKCVIKGDAGYIFHSEINSFPFTRETSNFSLQPDEGAETSNLREMLDEKFKLETIDLDI